VLGMRPFVGISYNNINQIKIKARKHSAVHSTLP
jgi:hypothetical protein